MCANLDFEHHFYFIDAIHQFIHLIFSIVQVKTGSSGGGDAELFMQRHGAMMAGPDGDALAIENLGDIVWMHFLEHK